MLLSSFWPDLFYASGPIAHPLHIPDGFLSLLISLFFWLLTIIVVGMAVRAIGDSLGERQIPLVGVLAAGIFATQMLNFPVFGGTSGHMLGGALAAIVLGPWAAILAMTAVISVQALVFQDGGLLVMGANIFDMGILTSIVGYGVYRLAAGQKKNVRLVAAGFGAWASVMAAALAASLQIWLSGNAEAALLFPMMMGVHALIGLGEGLLTVGALLFIDSTRPDLLAEESVKAHGSVAWVPLGLLVALAVTLLAPFASTSPDGLEYVATEIGLIVLAQEAQFELLPNYTLPFLGDTALSTILAGLIGALIVFALLYPLISRLKKNTP